MANYVLPESQGDIFTLQRDYFCKVKERKATNLHFWETTTKEKEPSQPIGLFSKPNHIF